MKCEICGKKIGELFLGKAEGTVVKGEKGKKFWICNECQAKFRSKEEIIRNIK